MSPADFASLAPCLQPGKASRGTILFHKDEPVEHIWFLESGIGSLITVSDEGSRVESGVFGRDGFGPVAFAMDSDRSPIDGQAQSSIRFHRIEAGIIKAALAQSPDLRALLLRYAHTLSVQTSYTALSNAIHTVDQRLARWLLMLHDRVDGDELRITHEFLSTMLAVRRPSVTTSLHVLEGEGLIRSKRGCVMIRDRAAMEVFASDSYGPPEREYERLLGPMR